MYITGINYPNDWARSQQLQAVQARRTAAMARIASGLRVMTAADDPAGLGISEQLTALGGSTVQALRNTRDGIAILDTTDGALSQVADALRQLRDLSVQAGNGALNAADHAALDAEAQGLRDTIDQITSSTAYNGMPLLDGTYNKTLQVGPNAGDTVQLTLPVITSTSLGVAGLPTDPGALSALSAALNAVTSARAGIAATTNTLIRTADSTSTSLSSITSARSAVSDTDYTEAVTEEAQASIQGAVTARLLNQTIATRDGFFQTLLTVPTRHFSLAGVAHVQPYGATWASILGIQIDTSL